MGGPDADENAGAAVVSDLHVALPAFPVQVQLVGVDVNVKTREVWTISRGSRVWQGSTFDGQGVLADQSPIPEPVIVGVDLDKLERTVTTGAAKFYLPHAVRVDPTDSNLLWVVDVGAHAVFKYDVRKNVVVQTAGVLHAPGSDSAHFCKPTDVAFSKDGTRAFVTDGYCNSRVVELAVSDMSFVRQYERKQWLDVPHAIARVECDGSEYMLVADREGGRVAVLDIAKKSFLPQPAWPPNGVSEGVWMPYSLAVVQNRRLVLGLTKRHGADRNGMVWVGNQAVCDLVTSIAAKKDASKLRSASWESQGAFVDNSALREPHSMSADTAFEQGGGASVLIAQAVDGGKEGGCVASVTVN